MNLELEQDFVNALISERVLPFLKDRGFRALRLIFEPGRIILRGRWYLIPFSISFRLVSFSGRNIHFSVDGPPGVILSIFSVEQSMFRLRRGMITLDLSTLDIPGRIRDIRIGGGRLRLTLR